MAVNIEVIRSKNKLEILTYFTIFLLGFSRFLPFPYAPVFVHKFFSIGIIITFGGFVLLLFVLILVLIKKFSFINWLCFFLLYLVLFLFSSSFQNLNNRIVIWINSSKSPSSFVNPFLGMELKKSEEVINPEGKVMFIFNKDPFALLGDSSAGYSALVFKENHGLEESQKNGELEAYYQKIYNNDWFWYEDIQ